MKYLTIIVYYLPLTILAFEANQKSIDFNSSYNNLRKNNRRACNNFINQNNDQQGLFPNDLMEQSFDNIPSLEAKQGIFNADNSNEPKYAISAPDGRNLKISPKTSNIDINNNSNNNISLTKSKSVKDSSGADLSGSNLIVMDEKGNIVKNAAVLSNQKISTLNDNNINKGSENNVNLVKILPQSLKLVIPEDKENLTVISNSDFNNISENYNSIESEKLNKENYYYKSRDIYNQYTGQLAN